MTYDNDLQQLQQKVALKKQQESHKNIVLPPGSERKRLFAHR